MAPGQCKKTMVLRIAKISFEESGITGRFFRGIKGYAPIKIVWPGPAIPV
jgi:hypothetical protein